MHRKGSCHQQCLSVMWHGLSTTVGIFQPRAVSDKYWHLSGFVLVLPNDVQKDSGTLQLEKVTVPPKIPLPVTAPCSTKPFPCLSVSWGNRTAQPLMGHEARRVGCGPEFPFQFQFWRDSLSQSTGNLFPFTYTFAVLKLLQSALLSGQLHSCVGLTSEIMNLPCGRFSSSWEIVTWGHSRGWETCCHVFAEICWGTSTMASGVHVAEQERRIGKDMMIFNVYN